jgi:DNA (cytosine-5)-methyltransferase 1
MNDSENVAISNDRKTAFQRTLMKWFKDNKRDFPWRYETDPYKVLISEMLLQKTDAARVLPVYNAIIGKYPTIALLRNANVSDLRHHLKGIGLFYRADRLINACGAIVDGFSGKVPSEKNELFRLKGLGEYIASAVCCFAFNQRESIVDTNIVRLFERIFGYSSPKKRSRNDPRLWNFAETLLPVRKVRDYNFALLDFSALQCTARNPKHEDCVMRRMCRYYEQLNDNNKQLAMIDIFAGAGGLSLGFEKAGFNIICAIEKDKYAAETYRKNRSRKRFIIETRDINEISAGEILQRTGVKKGSIDIIIGGPPCQGFSTSNKRTRNMDNPRNHLVFKFVEFVKYIEPKWFVMENVGGLDSFENGDVRKQLLDKFTSIGYKTESFIVNAVNFGVPQNRNRIFFIGNNIGNSMDFVKTITNKAISKPTTVHDAISDLPSLQNGHAIDKMSYDGNWISSYQRRLRAGMNGQVSNNLVSKNSELAIERYMNIRQGENLSILARKQPKLVSNYKNIENCHHWIYLRLSSDKPSVALNNFRKNMLIHPTENRGLSVREAARLQSFPDKYVFYGPLGFQQQQVANAVPPLLAMVIAKAILESYK